MALGDLVLPDDIQIEIDFPIADGESVGLVLERVEVVSWTAATWGRA